MGGRDLFDDLQPVAGSVAVCRVARFEYAFMIVFRNA
jgi:hypothetical protein